MFLHGQSSNSMTRIVRSQWSGLYGSFPLKWTIKKGNNSVITCDRVTILAFCTSSDSLLSMCQVSFNSLLYFQRYAPDKLFMAKIKRKVTS